MMPIGSRDSLRAATSEIGLIVRNVLRTLRGTGFHRLAGGPIDGGSRTGMAVGVAAQVPASEQLPVRHWTLALQAAPMSNWATHVRLSVSQYAPSAHSRAWSMQAAPIDLRTAQAPTVASQKSPSTHSSDSPLQ